MNDPLEPTMPEPDFLHLHTIGLLATLTLACASSSGALAPDQNTVPTGTWGGQHVSMEVTASGAELEFDCAHGHIDEPLTIGASGSFEVRGTYTPERPGPRREDEGAGSPVRYSGKVDGRTMVLTILTSDGSADAAASFNLEHGRTPAIRKCS
jgi:hypothetical protein